MEREIRFQHEAYWRSSNQWSKTAIGIWDFGLCDSRRCYNMDTNCKRSCLLLSSTPTTQLNVIKQEKRASGDDDKRDGVTGRHGRKNRRVGQQGPEWRAEEERRTVYFGRSDRAYKFFESNGFPCPSHQNPSDHYLHTINTDFDEDMDRVFHANKTTEEAISFLVRSYKSSHTCQQIQRHVAEICIENREELKKGSQANFISQCLILTRRSFVNMYRDLGYYWLRLAIYIALCSGLGSVFYDIGSDNSSIQARGSLLMFTASFLTIMAIGGFPSFVEDMKCFKEEEEEEEELLTSKVKKF
ncbi:ABC TRANSPORTER G FAMILY MEMBER 11 [Salix koriyanagi]|uniref:ABC TRANSPORTER G FAMILY MEMBER 11 n=1 Tax=Salix koriyanagi TaxID=2511006 RepID=A0A9Q0PMP4_9ROSI|nr:ABC TRANSPORTER G FAMILY MEMBER 11 [Salix koriyanagi]